jgi:hypothetical protein
MDRKARLFSATSRVPDKPRCCWDIVASAIVKKRKKKGINTPPA